MAVSRFHSIMGIILAASSWTAVAYAQDMPPSGPAAADTDSSGLSDIVVTAQRRSENLQDVPISVATITSKNLSSFQVTGTQDLQTAVPGLEFQRLSTTGSSPFLRGVGINSANPGQEQPVAVYIDDVYVGTPQADMFQLANIEQIEVLKGPQGTLFGRNATGGLINIRTKRPSHDNRMEANVRYSRFNTINGTVYATAGLSDTVAINIAAYVNDQGGYVRNISRNEKTYSDKSRGVRGQLLWEPSSRTTVLVSADVGTHTAKGGLQPLPGTVSVGGVVNTGKYVTEAGQDVGIHSPSWGVSARIEQDIDFAKLVSITSRHIYKGNAIFDQDLAKANIIGPINDSRTRNLSQELQLQSNSNGPLNWIVGLYYFNANTLQSPLRITGTAAGANVYTDIIDTQDLKSYAVFAEVGWEFLPKAKLTVGGRFTRDHFKLDVDPRVNAFGVVYQGAAGAAFSASSTFKEPTYRAILDYHFTDDVMAYASYSRGFKSGGYNVPTPGNAPTGAPPVSPETLDAYEVGIKSQFLDNHVRFNAAAFMYDYKNLQVTASSGAGTSLIINAAAARIKGVDFDTTVALGDQFTLTFAGAFLDTEYRDFPNAFFYVPLPAACPAFPTPQPVVVPTGGNRRCVGNLAGNHLSRSPKFTGSLSANYTIPTETGDFALSASIYHNSGFFWEASNVTRQRSYDLVSGSLTWTAPSKQFSLGVWGKNLLDKFYYSYVAENAQAFQGAPAMPRTIGVSASVNF